MDLATLHGLLPASSLVGDGATRVLRVHSDTRSLRPGDLFVAIKGERFDAHDFLAQAQSSGAAAVLAERGIGKSGLPGIKVSNTRRALTTLAAGWRSRFELPMIAVTGSNGKTTVTQMIASILRAWVGDGAFSTEGNFNNDIGVPLTLLRLRDDDTARHRAGVVELGMNHPGEMAQLAAITRPSVVLVNNAQREHLEFMRSVEAVARENGSAIAALGPQGTAVFPADDAHSAVWRELAGTRTALTFALSGPADVTAQASWRVDHWQLALRTPQGDAEATLQVAGLHNVRNALAAVTCALAAGCPLAAALQGLGRFQAVKGRSQLKSCIKDGRRIALVDDTYNANPDSMRAAIDVLAGLPAPRWLVLGDMGEVGDQGPAFHTEVGAYAQDRGIDALWTAGDASRNAAAAFPGARHFHTVRALVAALPQAPDCQSVLVKGSRFMQMEQVVSALISAAAEPQEHQEGAADAA